MPNTTLSVWCASGEASVRARLSLHRRGLRVTAQADAQHVLLEWILHLFERMHPPTPMLAWSALLCYRQRAYESACASHLGDTMLPMKGTLTDECRDCFLCLPWSRAGRHH
jgi:hypothetical protein